MADCQNIFQCPTRDMCKGAGLCLDNRLEAAPKRKNPFADCDTVTELLGQMVGAGSTCWIGGTGDAVFDDIAARQVVEDGVNRLIELGWA